MQRRGDYKRKRRTKSTFFCLSKNAIGDNVIRSYCLLTTEDYRAARTTWIVIKHSNFACVFPIMRLIHHWEFQRTVSFGDHIVKEGSSPFEILMLLLQLILVSHIQMNGLIFLSSTQPFLNSSGALQCRARPLSFQLLTTPAYCSLAGILLKKSRTF